MDNIKRGSVGMEFGRSNGGPIAVYGWRELEETSVVKSRLHTTVRRPTDLKSVKLPPRIHSYAKLDLTRMEVEPDLDSETSVLSDLLAVYRSTLKAMISEYKGYFDPETGALRSVLTSNRESRLGTAGCAMRNIACWALEDWQKTVDDWYMAQSNGWSKRASACNEPTAKEHDPVRAAKAKLHRSELMRRAAQWRLHLCDVQQDFVKEIVQVIATFPDVFNEEQKLEVKTVPKALRVIVEARKQAEQDRQESIDLMEDIKSCHANTYPEISAWTAEGKGWRELQDQLHHLRSSTVRFSNEDVRLAYSSYGDGVSKHKAKKKKKRSKPSKKGKELADASAHLTEANGAGFAYRTLFDAKTSPTIQTDHLGSPADDTGDSAGWRKVEKVFKQDDNLYRGEYYYDRPYRSNVGLDLGYDDSRTDIVDNLVTRPRHAYNSFGYLLKQLYKWAEQDNIPGQKRAEQAERQEYVQEAKRQLQEELKLVRSALASRAATASTEGSAPKLGWAKLDIPRSSLTFDQSEDIKWPDAAAPEVETSANQSSNAASLDPEAPEWQPSLPACQGGPEQEPYPYHYYDPAYVVQLQAMLACYGAHQLSYDGDASWPQIQHDPAYNSDVGESSSQPPAGQDCDGSSAPYGYFQPLPHNDDGSYGPNSRHLEEGQATDILDQSDLLRQLEEVMRRKQAIQPFYDRARLRDQANYNGYVQSHWDAGAEELQDIPEEELDTIQEEDWVDDQTVAFSERPCVESAASGQQGHLHWSTGYSQEDGNASGL